MKWLELSVKVSSEAVESVADLFRQYGQGGVVIEEDITPLSEMGNYMVNLDKPVTVRTYLPANAGVARKRKKIEQALWHLSAIQPMGPLQIKKVAEEDWANAWKAYFDVHRVGERLVIKPSWREYEAKQGDIVIELDPGMAFGTGCIRPPASALWSWRSGWWLAQRFSTSAPARASSPSRRRSLARLRSRQRTSTRWP